MSTKEKGAHMIGERMRLARCATALTLQEVSDRLSSMGITVTKAGLSKYEKGGSIPKAHFLMNLGRVLGVKSAFFLEEPTITIEWLAFRKRASMTKSSIENIHAYARKVTDGQFWLQSSLYPKSQIKFPRRKTRRIKVETAEKEAESLRDLWGLGKAPIESVTEAVEDNSGIVVSYDGGEAKFDGLSGWINNLAALVVLNKSTSDDRKRYNIAHELGHLCSGNGGTKDDEDFANRFASAFLIPKSEAIRELGEKRRKISFSEFGQLKLKWGISIQALIRRAHDLEIIDFTSYKTLSIIVSRKGWKKVEPWRFIGRETPTKLKQMTMRACNEGMITSEKAELLCPGCCENIEEDMEDKIHYSPREIMKLPISERRRILETATLGAVADYSKRGELLNNIVDEIIDETEDEKATSSR